MENIRRYSEFIKLPTFEDRFEYLKLSGTVGEDTFGYDRYLNQMFYKSREWKKIRDEVIIRDNACDLAMPGHEIYKYVLIHHMNPISKMDILDATDILLNPEYLISVTRDTHNAIHFGDKTLLQSGPISRTQYDTCPWKRRQS